VRLDPVIAKISTAKRAHDDLAEGKHPHRIIIAPIPCRQPDIRRGD
jgi:hypothetical protein